LGYRKQWRIMYIGETHFYCSAEDQLRTLRPSI